MAKTYYVERNKRKRLAIQIARAYFGLPGRTHVSPRRWRGPSRSEFGRKNRMADGGGGA